MGASILNEKLEKILLKRVDEILDGWKKTLDEDWDITKNQRDADDEDEDDEDALFRRKSPIKHTIKINNNLLLVQPSISDAKMLLGQDLQSLLSMIVSQPRPKSDSARDNGDADEDNDDDEDGKNTFKSILNDINMEKMI